MSMFGQFVLGGLQFLWSQHCIVIFPAIRIDKSDSSIEQDRCTTISQSLEYQCFRMVDSSAWVEIHRTGREIVPCGAKSIVGR